MRVPSVSIALATALALSALPARSEGSAVGGAPFEERLAATLGQPGGLVAEEVAERVAASSYDVRAQEARIEGAAADVDDALLRFFPRLTLTARYARLSDIHQPPLGELVAAPGSPTGPLAPDAQLANVPLTFPVVLNQYLIKATLTIPLSDYLVRLRAGRHASERGARAAELEAKVVQLGAAAQGRALYYAWVRARLQSLVASQAVTQARAHVDVAQALFDEGRGAKVDVLRVESQRASAELLDERARVLAQTLAEQLRMAMHDEGPSDYAIGERLEPDGEELPPPLPTLYAQALASRPELAAVKERERALLERERATRASGWPRVDAFGNVYIANPNARFIPQEEAWHATFDVGVQVTWTPNDVGSSGSARRELGARLSELRAQRRALEEAIMREVLGARRAILDARAASRAAEEGWKAAEEAYRVRTELYEYGRTTVVELLDAETELLRARLQKTNAMVDLRAASAQLDHALGRDEER